MSLDVMIKIKHTKFTNNFQCKTLKIGLKGFVLPNLSNEPYNAHWWWMKHIDVRFEL